ncbi:glutathione S-transferase N-terminal domain-containing protein [Actibacterium ureilyticum]|uniref:glutathione S-transferase N-terminal domain-containing protein n=1 Tax=Actibacterium ureilyticum TaxID=1590614 RepID=UPI000BAAA5BF|nr:glutathione S-transferase N-terminal domain-containing protein [Actibacterium ureilyticum]
MPTLTDFSIASRWAPRDPQAIQLYSFPTPNGVKASIMLEETGLPYDAHKISILDDDQFTPEFLQISPNNKIPAIIDPDGPGGQAIPIFESGAILIYLAEKTGQLLPADPAKRMEVLQWLMFQMGSVGPMFGQLGFFYKFAGAQIEDPRPRDRYIAEAKRILGVIDKQLDGRDWITGEYSIADIAIWPWIRTLRDFYEAGAVTDFDSFANVGAALDRFLDRPAVQRGLLQPPRD